MHSFILHLSHPLEYRLHANGGPCYLTFVIETVWNGCSHWASTQCRYVKRMNEWVNVEPSVYASIEGNLCVRSHSLFQQVLSFIVPTRTQDKNHTEERVSFFHYFSWQLQFFFFQSGQEFLTILRVSLFTLLSHSVFPFLFRAKVRSLAGLCQNFLFIYFFSCFFFFFRFHSMQFSSCLFGWLISPVMGRGKERTSVINYTICW